MATHPDWLTELLGPRTVDVVARIPDGLRTANERAKDAQTASRLRQLNPYGNSLWLAVHEEMVAAAAASGEFAVYRPEGASYDIPVVNDTAIYAYRQDSRVKESLDSAAMEPRRIRDALVALSNRMPRAQVLEFGAGEEEGWGTSAPVWPRRALLVPFVANADSGVLGAGLGQGRLRADGFVEWVHFVPLDLDLYRAAPQRLREVDAEPRFDTGMIPVPSMSPRRRKAISPVDEDEIARAREAAKIVSDD